MQATKQIKYYQLPNGDIVAANEDNLISFLIKVNVAELLSKTFTVDNYLDKLFDQSLGAFVWFDKVSFAVESLAGNNCVIVRVTGRITSAIVKNGVTAVGVPAKSEYDIEICRTGFGFHTVTVEAATAEEAQQIALESAGNHLYSEKSSEYSIVSAVMLT